jgi:hypothetical protein
VSTVYKPVSSAALIVMRITRFTTALSAIVMLAYAAYGFYLELGLMHGEQMDEFVQMTYPLAFGALLYFSLCFFMINRAIKKSVLHNSLINRNKLITASSAQ